MGSVTFSSHGVARSLETVQNVVKSPIGSFSSEAVKGVAAPFLDDRLAALDRAEQSEFPTPDEEIWRYSRIDELDLGNYTATTLDTTVTGDAALLPTITDLDAYPQLDIAAPDLFAELNAAFAVPTVVAVPAGKTIAEPIVITHVVPNATAEGAPAVFARTFVDVGEDAEVTVIERFTGGDGALAVPVVQIRAAGAARVRYLAVNDLAATAWQIGHQQATGDADSTVELNTVAFGGYYARTRTEAQIVGRGATTKQTALYFADGDQMHDFRTIQDHVAAHGDSELLFKGAVQDQSASVYTGLIKIRPGARGTNAFQTNRNLTLGAGSWAKSVPNLEIEDNDVRCSHASTVGPIDPEHRFYLESRGVPTAVAERLIVLGFFDEVLAKLPAADLAAELRQRVADKFDPAKLDRTER